MRKSLSKAVAVALLAGLLAACKAPAGTQFWVQVNREYESRDYEDTLGYLNELLRTENGFTERAAAWKVALFGALTRADIDIEGACSEGVYHVAEWDSKDLKNCIAQYRRQVKVHTLALVDALTEFENVTAASGTVSLDFPLHRAGLGTDSFVERLRVGVMAADVFEASVMQTVDRQIVFQAKDLLGETDAANVVKAFESLPVTVPKAVFLTGVARTLVMSAAVFGEGKLDDFSARKLVLERARKCLEPALADPATQPKANALAKEIEDKLRS